MAVTLDCPNCEKSRTYLEVPTSGCPYCEAPYPPDRLESATVYLARQAAPRPTSLTIGMYASTAFGSLFLLGLACAAFDVGTFTIDNVQVTGPEFLVRAGFPFALVGLFFVAIGYAIWRERLWTRHLIVAGWMVLIAVGFVMALIVGQPIGSAVFTAVTGLVIIVLPTCAYFYLKDSVVAYYKALRLEQVAQGRGQRHGA